MQTSTDNFGRTIITHGDYSVIITVAPRGEKPFEVNGGHFDRDGSFTVAHSFHGKQYKSMKTAERYAKRWLKTMASR